MQLTPLPLDAAYNAFVGALPGELAAIPFDPLWDLHPPEFHILQMMGKPMPSPRWSQAFGRDYRYSGNVNVALPVPPPLQPFLDAARTLDTRINGLLVNWYDGDLGHYIGKHRDSPVGLIEGAPIITLSLGAPRTFRFRKYRGAGLVDVDTGQHPVIVFGGQVNRVFSHEVVKGTGRRISITARAFR